MPNWYADGDVSGVKFVPNSPASAQKDITKDAYKLTTNGTVDVNAITRLQYPVPISSKEGAPKFRNGIDITARISFNQYDVDGARNAGQVLSACTLYVDAANFPEGQVPTPLQVTDKGAYGTYVLNGGGTLTPGNYEFTNSGFVPQPGRKYWALTCPVRIVSGATPGVGTVVWLNITIAPLLARVISIWGNRSPVAPVVTSPAPDSVFASGSTFDFTYTTADPDRIFGSEGYEYSDIAGVQVQYAPRPTADDPSPTWIDLPIATYNTGTVGAGAGWYIDRSKQNVPFADINNGAYYLWALGTMKVACGSSGLSPGYGILPAGNWQVRMRVFDYGHPWPRFFPPLAEDPLNRTPDNYPSFNASPWSTPIRVSVSSQVPPPVPVSPTANQAIAFGKPITLSWLYRNTYSPPYAQARRLVFIRKVGAAAWTKVTDTFTAATSYLVTQTVSGNAPIPEFEYIPGSTFEGGTVDGWAVGSSASTTGVAISPGSEGAGTTHKGAYAIKSTGTGAAIVVKTITNLNAAHQYFTFSGWSKLGPTTAKHRFALTWLNSAGNAIVTSTFVDRAPGSGWVQTFIPNQTKPAGAVSVQVGVIATPTTGQTSTAGDLFDDFSFVGGAPGSVPFTFEPSTQYEWYVQVVDASGQMSNPSLTSRFWIVPVPASGTVIPAPLNTIDAATLGCGKHRAYIYRRGGTTQVGELTEVSHLDWSRVRDDISTAKVEVSGWSLDCGIMLSMLQTWAYELVIFRDNGYGKERVWEGPITLLTYETDKVTVEAKDVMAYAYRRIVKQAMNDFTTGGDTVTSRGARVLQNALAPDDPNVLAYMQVLSDSGDAKEYRSLPPFTRTAFEEVDDMAANAGLDYTCVGRSIVLWGTKHRIGTLPEFTDKDLGNAPIVSEYGMSAANFYSVADGTGVHGDANRLSVSGNDTTYGLIEMLSSSWASDSDPEAGTYTQDGLAKVIKSFTEYAERSIAERYPPPVIVRVPDNTTLNPDAVVSIQHLVPGVVIPLRSVSTLRSVAADQKLDRVSVVEEAGMETISITMSPFSREDVAEETTS